MDSPVELKILSCHLDIAKAKLGQGPFGVERTLLQFCGILVLGFFFGHRLYTDLRDKLYNLYFIRIISIYH